MQTYNATVKLPHTHRERFSSLAIHKKRSSHFLMREAILKYLVSEERDAEMEKTAMVSIEHYNRTWLHVTLDEVEEWMRSIAINPNTPSLICHT